MELPNYIKVQLDLIDEVSLALEKEKIKRVNIEFSEPYLALNAKIDLLESQKRMLLEGVEDVALAARLASLKTGLLAVLEREGREKVGKWKVKFTEKKSVNCQKVFDLLKGDQEHFLRLATITQKALEAETKVNARPELLTCIEVTERKVTDLVPLETER